jgi:hypothetical protein
MRRTEAIEMRFLRAVAGYKLIKRKYKLYEKNLEYFALTQKLKDTPNNLLISMNEE